MPRALPPPARWIGTLGYLTLYVVGSLGRFGRFLGHAAALVFIPPLKLGRLVATGLLEEARVHAELAAAARAVGLGDHEITKTIRRGLADARRHATASGRVGGGRG